MKQFYDYLLTIGVCLLLVSFDLAAHNANEETLFPDIQQSKARFDITLLVSVGIIPETRNFQPDKALSGKDLAAWAALAEGLLKADETPDIDTLAERALNKGLADTIDGNANYADINKVLFKGKLLPASPEAVPSRADAASYIAANLAGKLEGESWLESKSMQFGPTGKISKLESRMNPDGSHSFYVTIADETYPVYSHGKVANGPVDLIEWKGRVVRRSVIRALGQLKLWVFLEADD